MVGEAEGEAEEEEEKGNNKKNARKKEKSSQTFNAIKRKQLLHGMRGVLLHSLNIVLHQSHLVLQNFAFLSV